MSSYIVWIDTEHAKLFKMAPTGVELSTIKNETQEHHGFNPRDEHRDHTKFFHGVAQALNGVSELLIVGPGVAKEQFKHHLEKHHHPDLAKKVLAVESMDHPHDAQILAHARKFFKHAHLFT